MEQEYKFGYKHYDSPEYMPQQDSELLAAAREAINSAYAPFSGFKVGAAARLKSGKILTASNQESAVSPAGVCAERNLLYYIQANYASDPVEAIAIASAPDERECYPCGICRQVMADSQQRQGSAIKVIMGGRNSATVVDDSLYLLPFTFRL